jgi:hypothetical protein
MSYVDASPRMRKERDALAKVISTSLHYQALRFFKCPQSLNRSLIVSNHMIIPSPLPSQHRFGADYYYFLPVFGGCGFDLVESQDFRSIAPCPRYAPVLARCVSLPGSKRRGKLVQISICSFEAQVFLLLSRSLIERPTPVVVESLACVTDAICTSRRARWLTGSCECIVGSYSSHNDSLV